MLPLLLYEDDHLLVVNKPAGWNTHAPDPYANEGIYDWLRHREPRWSSLAIIHRLDKETSGLVVFSKTSAANRSLTAQFAEHTVNKRYVFLTDAQPPRREHCVRSIIARAGDKYVSFASGQGGASAETRFRVLDSPELAALTSGPLPAGVTAIEARPLTGRTHQIRVHAAEAGIPILGDTLYGGSGAGRVFLHSAQLTFAHPATAKAVTFKVPFDLQQDPRTAIRMGIIEPDLTDCFRLVNGAADGWPGWYVDRLGKYLLSQSAGELEAEQRLYLERLLARFCLKGGYHKVLARHVRRIAPLERSPKLVAGDPAPSRFLGRENGLEFELSFEEGYSVGLFLDQRDNRRRLISRHVAGGFTLPGPAPQLLNTFAYTCGFSVCAGASGARTTSLDLSQKYLNWGRSNFGHNHIPLDTHDFIFGDVFNWLHRLAKKGRRWNIVLLDPPTFSQSKASGVWRAQRDYGKLVQAALTLLSKSGVLLASCNTADWPASEFIPVVTSAVRSTGRKVLQQHYVPQPPDFPISRAEPAYLKTLWLRVD